MRGVSPQSKKAGDTGNKIEEKAKTEGALVLFPASAPKVDYECLPLSNQPPGPDPGAARAVWYLRMVCVIDVWRCSTGRRGS